MLNKFWNWIRDDSGGRVLRLEGPIDSESFWGDETTPKSFREDLYAEEGDITLWINSPGGSVFAAAEIYSMLRDYPGKVTVRIASVAASAASVVAMAGDLVQISPTGLLMLHDPSTIAMGNAKDMEKAITTLNEVKESIINAYAFKTGLSRNRISKLMENETWISARKAVEWGFADEILFEDGNKPAPAEKAIPEPEEKPDEEKPEEKPADVSDMWQYSTRIMDEVILNRIGVDTSQIPEVTDELPVVERLPMEDAEQPAPEPEEDSVVNPPAEEQKEESAALIGLDGKTKDGAMPYLILKDKLEWMK